MQSVQSCGAVRPGMIFRFLQSQHCMDVISVRGVTKCFICLGVPPGVPGGGWRGESLKCGESGVWFDSL